jgi:hypothetical protein
MVQILKIRWDVLNSNHPLSPPPADPFSRSQRQENHDTCVHVAPCPPPAARAQPALARTPARCPRTAHTAPYQRVPSADPAPARLRASNPGCCLSPGGARSTPGFRARSRPPSMPSAHAREPSTGSNPRSEPGPHHGRKSLACVPHVTNPSPGRDSAGARSRPRSMPSAHAREPANPACHQQHSTGMLGCQHRAATPHHTMRACTIPRVSEESQPAPGIPAHAPALAACHSRTRTREPSFT